VQLRQLRPAVLGETVTFEIWNGKQMAGMISLTPEKYAPKKAQVGYFVGEDFRRRGYATEALELLTGLAFARLGYEILWAEVNELNPGSMGVLERGGFVKRERYNGQVRFELSRPGV